ncbi:DsbC family protein [Guyparkeria halophila]|uniref:Thiol:disulfide interchange protein n=1 Tax=Guyparkeria halophila TaxID=47960 RepID=A0ABZ0YXC5_9GAMM|nr:DsbC family protein [Guyparkeria halophila]WQH16813.1 DsbC family protein [Guyparkeria halophila]
MRNTRLPLATRRGLTALPPAFALAFALALPSTAVMADDKDAITASIQKHMPGVPIDSIEETPAKGIYELTSNGQIAYVTADGKYLIAGDLIDVENRQNLTQGKQDAQRIAALEDVPGERKLVYPADGETRHSITILTDPTCPFCDKLHKELPKLREAGVEVTYILTPRQGPGSKGFEISSKVACADDPKDALDRAMKGGSVDAQACRNDMIKENMALSSRLGMSGTPYTILPNGAAMPGYRPANVVLQAIEQSGG